MPDGYVGLRLIGRERRKVSAGEVFAMEPDDGLGYFVGQVIKPHVVIGGPPCGENRGVLIVVFDRRWRELPSAELLGRFPHGFGAWRHYITNLMGWRDGCFVKVGDGAPVSMAGVGFVDFTDAQYDVDNARVTPAQLTRVKRNALSPYLAIVNDLIRNPS
jgi:hypothetical protein